MHLFAKSDRYMFGSRRLHQCRVYELLFGLLLSRISESSSDVTVPGSPAVCWSEARGFLSPCAFSFSWVVAWYRRAVAWGQSPRIPPPRPPRHRLKQKRGKTVSSYFSSSSALSPSDAVTRPDEVDSELGIGYCLPRSCTPHIHVNKSKQPTATV